MIYGCGAQVCLRGTFDPGEAISLIQAQVAASARGGCVRFQMHGAPGGLRTSAVWVRDLLAAVEIDDADGEGRGIVGALGGKLAHPFAHAVAGAEAGQAYGGEGLRLTASPCQDHTSFARGGFPVVASARCACILRNVCSPREKGSTHEQT